MLTHWLQHSVFPDFKITAYWWGIGRGYWTVALTGLFFFKKNKTMKINKNFLRVCACVCVVLYWLLSWWDYGNIYVTGSAFNISGRDQSISFLSSSFLPLFHGCRTLDLQVGWGGSYLVHTGWGVCHIPEECLGYPPARDPLEDKGILPKSDDSAWTQTLKWRNFAVCLEGSK